MFDKYDYEYELDLASAIVHTIFTPQSFMNYVRNNFAIYDGIPVTISKERERVGDTINIKYSITSTTHVEMEKTYEVYDYEQSRVHNIRLIEFMNMYKKYMTVVKFDDDEDTYYVSEDSIPNNTKVEVYEKAIDNFGLRYE